VKESKRVVEIAGCPSTVTSAVPLKLAPRTSKIVNGTPSVTVAGATVEIDGAEGGGGGGGGGVPTEEPPPHPANTIPRATVRKVREPRVVVDRDLGRCDTAQAGILLDR
jgi:hypothetical protein